MQHTTRRSARGSRRSLELSADVRRSYATTVSVVFLAFGLMAQKSRSLSRAPPRARTRKPMPLSRRAIPTTRPKSAICEAVKARLSAEVRAVSWIQTLRRPFSTGCFVCGSTSAHSELLVAPGPASSRLRRVGLRLEAAHLREGQTARRLERVDVHVLRERPRLGARVDRLVRDALRRDVDLGHVETGLLRLRGDARGGHVRRADDVLCCQVVLDRAVAVHAEGDRSDAECNQDDACDEPTHLE